MQRPSYTALPCATWPVITLRHASDVHSRRYTICECVGHTFCKTRESRADGPKYSYLRVEEMFSR